VAVHDALALDLLFRVGLGVLNPLLQGLW